MAFTLRLEPDVEKELDELASMYGVSKNTVVNSLIRAEYDKVSSDPKIKLALDKINELKSWLEQAQNQLNQ